MRAGSPWCRGVQPDCNCQGRNTQRILQQSVGFPGRRMQKHMRRDLTIDRYTLNTMMKEKYKLLRTPTRLSKQTLSLQEKGWISDGYIDNVTTLQEQEGFSLQMVEYHYGNTSNPYLMHDCDPEEDLIEKAWYATAESTDNNLCIYCKKPYPTEILTAAKLLNASLAYKFEP